MLQQIPFRYVVNDVGYAAAVNMGFVKQMLLKTSILPHKPNRKLSLGLAEKQAVMYEWALGSVIKSVLEIRWELANLPPC